MSRDLHGSPQGRAQLAMEKSLFTLEQRREWFIWGAKMRTCKRCGSTEGKPCMNLTARKAGVEVPTKWPHDGRVDWDRVIEGLKKRGYIGG